MRLSYHTVLLFTVMLPKIAAANELPNIILCMGDDHGWEEVGYNGHPHLQTPILDEMAATGLRFDYFYAGHPTCSPTRGSVLTGRHPNRYGTFTPGHSIRPEEITIAHLLKQAGYRCGHFGKWHLGPVKKSSLTNPGMMGFDEWVSHDNFFELNPVLSRNGEPPQEFPGESSQVVVDEAIRFINQSQADDKPFLAVIWFGSPHEPYSGLPEDLALYEDLPKSYAKKTVSLTSNETGTRVKRPLRDVLQERFAEITAMDRSLGHLREHLKQKKLRENTILWYYGDNGTPPSGLATSPFRGLKGQVYEGGIRVPGVLEWPAKIDKPMTTDIPAVTSDFLPTLCEITGQALPSRPIDGENLLPLFEGTMTERTKPICFWMFDMKVEGASRGEPYIDPELQKGTTPLVKLMKGIPTRNFVNFHHTLSEQHLAGHRVILKGHHKLVVKGNAEKPSTELFDLKADKTESQSLTEDEIERTKELSEELLSWQRSVLRSLAEDDY